MQYKSIKSTNMDNKENLNNLAPFYVGQKVVYITGYNMPKNTVCVVTAVFKKPYCNCWHIDINKPNPGGLYNHPGKYNCTECGSVYTVHESQLRGWAASSFRPLQEQSFPLIKYTRVLKDVPVSAN